LPSVSVICPTFQREFHLRNAVAYYCEQRTDAELELLILDDSPERGTFLDDPYYRGRNIRYWHVPGARLSIGAKLNILQQRAEGDIIVRFDDDDYYAPDYVEKMVRFLGDADFVTLSGWFAYIPATSRFAYWATDVISPTHYLFSAGEPLQVCSPFGDDRTFVARNLWGYGFSHVWRSSVLPEVAFDDIDINEDLEFYRKVVAAGCRTVCAADTEGLVLHLIHPGNTAARIYPQHLLPDFMLARYFPRYADRAGIRSVPAMTLGCGGVEEGNIE
jgi:glycosyltransferase involved in cell wall biosynthesis